MNLTYSPKFNQSLVLESKKWNCFLRLNFPMDHCSHDYDLVQFQVWEHETIMFHSVIIRPWMLSAKTFRGLEVLLSSVESCIPNWFVWSSCFETGSVFLSKTDEGQNNQSNPGTVCGVIANRATTSILWWYMCDFSIILKAKLQINLTADRKICSGSNHIIDLYIHIDANHLVYTCIHISAGIFSD